MLKCFSAAQKKSFNKFVMKNKLQHSFCDEIFAMNNLYYEKCFVMGFFFYETNLCWKKEKFHKTHKLKL